MAERAFQLLVEVIACNKGSLHKPIELWRDPQGQSWLIDGRARWRALETLGVDPESAAERYLSWLTFDDDAALRAYCYQRHRTSWEPNKSQLSMVAADHLKLLESKKNNHPTPLRSTFKGALHDELLRSLASPDKQRIDGRVAKFFDVNRTYLAAARRIRNNGLPILSSWILNGLLNIRDADHIARLPISEQNDLVEQGLDVCRDVGRRLRQGGTYHPPNAPLIPIPKVEPEAVVLQLDSPKHEQWRQLCQRITRASGRPDDEEARLEDVLGALMSELDNSSELFSNIIKRLDDPNDD